MEKVREKVKGGEEKRKGERTGEGMTGGKTGWKKEGRLESQKERSVRPWRHQHYTHLETLLKMIPIFLKVTFS